MLACAQAAGWAGVASGLGKMGASFSFHRGLEPDPVTSGCRRMTQAGSERLRGRGAAKGEDPSVQIPPHPSLVSFLLLPLFPLPLSHFPFLAYFWFGSFLSRQKCPADNSRLPYPSDPVTVSTERTSVFLTHGLLKGLSLALQIPLEIIASQLPSVDHDFGWWLSVFGSLGCQVISF